MRIIISTISCEKNIITVNADIEIGEIKGIWKSNVKPSKGDEYFVELTINDFNQEISYLTGEDISTKVILKDDTVLFIGVCEDIDEEVYYIRFDTDWLEMVEIPENSTKIKVGDYVMFSSKCNDILIYPYTI
ncbi:MAG: hypothetical protein HDT39_01140 [Lachnospiraceae bacterium]|nr:hypothetical protein [Lachnospiraceae bacterium]